MGDIVGLDGKSVAQPVPDGDTPEAVLQFLIDDIRAGRYDIKRMVICVEHDAGSRFFTRSSRMMNSEALALLAVSERLTMDALLGI